MTHDELLAKIDLCFKDIPVDYGQISARKALRAVVELHKPTIWEGKETGYCSAHQECWGCGEWGNNLDCDCNTYPCPTIQAIEKELM